MTSNWTLELSIVKRTGANAAMPQVCSSIYYLVRVSD